MTRRLALLALFAAGCAARSPATRVSHPAELARARVEPSVEEADGLRPAPAPAPAMVPHREPAPQLPFADGGLPGVDRRVNQDLTVRAQNEPAAAVNPGNPLHMVAAWCDNRLFYYDWNLQKTDLAYGVTFDGGQTWQSQRIAFAAIPAGAFTADPSVVFDASGNVYLGLLRYSPYDRSNPALNKVLVARSTNGGVSFAEPVQVDAGLVDKPWLAVDGTTLYVLWSDSDKIEISKSVNGGASFSAPVQLSTQGGNGPSPVIGPAGEVYVAWENPTNAVWFDKSANGGTTWGTDVAVTTTKVAPRSPLAGGYRNPPVPALAIDRSGGAFHGRLYAAWGDGRFGDPDVVTAWSSNAGASWSAPVRVNDDAVGNDADQFLPWITVDPAGGVHVVFLDRRASLDNGLTETYLATSTDGGASFGPNVRISDGAFPSTDYFAGDYNAVVAAGGNIFPFWPDGRDGDQDLFTRAVSLADFDGDTRLNDGDGDGQYAGTPCTGGLTIGCDDNCPGTVNPDQADPDGDGVGTACDNCPVAANAAQTDDDQDGQGNACDGCPSVAGRQPGDPDGDGDDGCVDNCPAAANANQADGDADGIGDACDACPATAVNDVDRDGLCANADNCPLVRNPIQRNSDGDSIGDLCDKCPEIADPTQPDDDFDGEGNACDCAETQLTDFEKRRPPAIDGVRIAKAPGVHRLVWKDVASADTFSVSRTLLSALAFGSYGACLANGIQGIDGIDLADVPPPGAGYAYLVVGWDAACGLGSAGVDTSERRRVNASPGACVGGP